MAEITQKVEMVVSATMKLTEGEMLALNAVASFSTDAILDALTKSLGHAYLRGHDAALRSFFEGVKRDMPPILDRAKRAADVFHGRGGR